MELGLEGKVAVITGGSEGIGRATALRLAREGAHVVICARRQEVLEDAADAIRERTNSRVTAVVADVTRPDQVERLFGVVADEHGGLDILVNNAGRAASHRFEDVTDDMWYGDLEIKLFGTIRCSRAAIAPMKRRGGGRIINVTTPDGKAPPAAALPTAVSRAGGIALTKAMSREHAGDNILVNAVCIGLIKSAQHERRFEQARREQPDLTLEAFYERAGAEVPLGRVGEAEEAGDVIAFLASERASYLTGVAINIDGGSSAVT